MRILRARDLERRQPLLVYCVCPIDCVYMDLNARIMISAFVTPKNITQC